MTDVIQIRPIAHSDYTDWLPLWDGYNAFYGRLGSTALDPAITACTWERFFDDSEPVFALVAELDGQIVGLTHYLYHRSTTRIAPVCYLQDLFTLADFRGRGIARKLIEGVVDTTRQAGVQRVYWQTHQSNATARLLYDRIGKHAGFIVYLIE